MVRNRIRIVDLRTMRNADPELIPQWMLPSALPRNAYFEKRLARIPHSSAVLRERHAPPKLTWTLVATNSYTLEGEM